jgi:hypothetical protein
MNAMLTSVPTKLSQVTSPFQFYIGARMLRPQPVGAPGSIRDIVIENVTATDMVNLGHGYPRNWTATLDGQPIDRKHGEFLLCLGALPIAKHWTREK